MARNVVLENAKRVRMTVGKDGRRMRLIYDRDVELRGRSEIVDYKV